MVYRRWSLAKSACAVPFSGSEDFDSGQRVKSSAQRTVVCGCVQIDRRRRFVHLGRSEQGVIHFRWRPQRTHPIRVEAVEVVPSGGMVGLASSFQSNGRGC